MAIVYKGAGPGTHWWINDPRTVGGFFCAPGRAPSAAAVTNHITVAPHPSPYLSFSSSFAVAVEYARVGPRGLATPTTPGYVWEVDTSIAALNVVDPIAEISAARKLAGVSSTDHDGGQDLILGIAAPSLHAAVLTTPPRRPGAALPHPPAISPDLNALIFALRDGELLVSGYVPPGCVLARHDVW